MVGADTALLVMMNPSRQLKPQTLFQGKPPVLEELMKTMKMPVSTYRKLYVDLPFRRTIFSGMRRSISHASPEIYTDIIGSEIVNNRNQFVSPFQCHWTVQRMASHIFHYGCIGIYIWKKCMRTELGRRTVGELTCPICVAVLDFH